MAVTNPTEPYDPEASDEALPPARPTTPPIRRGFVWLLLLLVMMTVLVYGVPLALDRIGYAYESGRARASTEALKKLDEAGVVRRASDLFRLATNAVSPAVVNIRTQSFSPGVAGSVGSGVIIDKARGLIVTNNHVIQGADLIEVRVGRRTQLAGELVGADPRTDLAVIRVRGTLPAEAPWGDSDHLEIGEWVIAIGSPFGLERSVTVGIVSATERSNLGIVGRDQVYENFIQTDASINPGNSGGPLVDLRGQVIGINTAIVSDDGAFKGIGLAIPSEMARKVVDQLIASGKVTRGYLGVMPQAVSAEQAEAAHLPDGRGASVARVSPGGPADKAGIQVDDIIVAVDGKPVTDDSSLRNKSFTLAVGSEVPVDVIRDGKPRTIRVKVGEMPPDPVVALFGMTVKQVAADAKGALEVDRVIPGSPADKAGLKVGDRVLSFGRGPLRFKSDFDFGLSQYAMGGMPGALQLFVVRGDQRLILPFGPGVEHRP